MSTNQNDPEVQLGRRFQQVLEVDLPNDSNSSLSHDKLKGCTPAQALEAVRDELPRIGSRISAIVAAARAHDDLGYSDDVQWGIQHIAEDVRALLFCAGQILWAVQGDCFPDDEVQL